MSIAIVFPGQGTQQPAMGALWRDHPAWHVIDDAEAAFGEPLAHLILDAGPDELARTREAQLAVLLTSLVAWEAIRDDITAPIAFGGHSLGQVTALIAAGVLPLDAGVRFAARRAELTQAAANAHPGRMAALLGATTAQAEDACTAAPDACWVANDNAPGQVVIAGTPDGVEAGSARAKELGVKRATPLNVGGAFHTPLMNPAATELHDVLGAIHFTKPSVPVVTNHDALMHDDAEGWPDRLTTHLVSPVRWADCVTTMVGLGVDRFIEVGPGNALAGLIRRIAPEASTVNVSVPADVAAVADLVGVV